MTARQVAVLLAVTVVAWIVAFATIAGHNTDIIEVETVGLVEADLLVANTHAADVVRWVDSSTTTRPAVRLIPKARARSAPNVVLAAAGTYKGLACGGDLPSCSVLRCENPAGDPQAQNPHSTASGVWQVVDGTWNGFGGYAKAKYAPVDVQNAKARLLWAGGAGRSHWKACL